MAVKVHGASMSTCTARVLACLHEKGVEYEFVSVGLADGAHKQQPFLSLNPFGLVPVLEDEDLTLFESRAITRYLAHKYKDVGTDLLRLESLPESASVNVWMEVEAHQFNGPMQALIYQFIVNPKFGLPVDEQVVESNSEKFGKVLDVYEERLSKSKYLAGDYFSMADLHHFPYIVYFMTTPKSSLITSRLHVNAWWEDIASRPSIMKIKEGLKFD
ncbi:hypothetical protein AAC387_Pa09g1463 [Persea americana]